MRKALKASAFKAFFIDLWRKIYESCLSTTKTERSFFGGSRNPAEVKAKVTS